MIPPIKKILYATDLTKNSIYAFYYAVDMAQRHGAEILILNVVESISERAYGSGTEKVQQDQYKVSMEVIHQRLQRICKRVEERDGLPCGALVGKIIVRTGDPAGEILKAVAEEGCDLLVLGRHGKGFLAQALLGSVSRSVSERAQKPLFLIPLPSEETSAWDDL
jgi:nucleotide-binding universal stress UspA family protein